ncbi:MAG: PilZ domain-containing protein [Myxococcaceae bacterium]
MFHSTEKRRHARKPVTLTVRHRRSDSAPTEEAETRDLSAGGVFLRMGRLARIGDTLDVEFPTTQAGKAPAHATGEVVRVSKDGVGVRFTQLDPDSALLINLLVSV